MQKCAMQLVFTVMIFTLFVLAETAITVSHVPSRAPLLPALCPALAATAIAIRMAGAGADACARMTGAVAYTANGEASRDSNHQPDQTDILREAAMPCTLLAVFSRGGGGGGGGGGVASTLGPAFFFHRRRRRRRRFGGRGCRRKAQIFAGQLKN